MQPNMSVKWTGSGNIHTVKPPPPLQSLPLRAQRLSSWSKLWKTHMGWCGPPLLSGLNEIQATDHTRSPGVAHSHNRWCFDFHFQSKKSFKITPWSQWIWGPCCQWQWQVYSYTLARKLRSWWQTHLQGWSGQSYVTMPRWHVSKPGGEVLVLPEAD